MRQESEAYKEATSETNPDTQHKRMFPQTERTIQCERACACAACRIRLGFQRLSLITLTLRAPLGKKCVSTL